MTNAKEIANRSKKGFIVEILVSIITFILGGAIILIVGIMRAVDSSTTHYVFYGGLSVMEKGTSRTAGVMGYYFDVENLETEVTIPDVSEKGYPISYIGSTEPRSDGSFFNGVKNVKTSWGTSLDNAESYYRNGKVPDENVYYYDITLNIGENIKNIYLRSKYVTMWDNGDGTYIIYCPRVYINCNENNPAFYSKDGKLYEKVTDKLVDGFVYYDFEFTK